MKAGRAHSAASPAQRGILRIASAALAAAGAAASAFTGIRSPASASKADHYAGHEDDRQPAPDADTRPFDGQPWTAQRLREVLRTHLEGQRVVVVANREPRIHDWNEDGEVAVRHPASGLVTALEPIMRACSGVWVAHGSGSADRAASDAHGRIDLTDGDTCFRLRRIWLTEEEERGYYYGFANQALWPLCHLAHTRPVFRRTDWEAYRLVNERFAAAVAAEADRDDPIVLVQDYHLALVPMLLRQRLPKATILSFWHIPWPNADRIAICPYHEDLLDGLLGSSIVGFQTLRHCRNFCDSVDRQLEARVDRDELAIAYQRRTTLVRSYPISIEWPNRWSSSAPPVDACRRAVRRELGLADDVPMVLSVDRLDYTKGIEERLATAERFLERGRRAAFVQVATPSRVQIAQYRRFGEQVRAEAERINARFGTSDFQPILFLNRHLEPPDVFRYYRAADLCYVSSLHDGMNLVAKEFVAARDDEAGVLVLSRFTGAARELTDAVVVNPYDVDGVADALGEALSMPCDEQHERMRAMRAVVAERNVYRWAGGMLTDAARLRLRAPTRGRSLWIRTLRPRSGQGRAASSPGNPPA